MTISNSGGRSPELSETTGVRKDLNVSGADREKIGIRKVISAFRVWTLGQSYVSQGGVPDRHGSPVDDDLRPQV